MLLYFDITDAQILQCWTAESVLGVLCEGRWWVGRHEDSQMAHRHLKTRQQLGRKRIYLSVKGFSWTGWGVVAKVDRHSRDGQKYKGSIKQRRQTKELPPPPSSPRPKRISIRIFIIDGHPFDFLSLSIRVTVHTEERVIYVYTHESPLTGSIYL
jgi:hypothetical protein